MPWWTWESSRGKRPPPGPSWSVSSVVSLPVEFYTTIKKDSVPPSIQNLRRLARDHRPALALKPLEIFHHPPLTTGNRFCLSRSFCALLCTCYVYICCYYGLVMVLLFLRGGDPDG